MSHTPGPWARNISTKYPIYTEADHRKIAIALNGHDIDDGEAMANLKLIAAAPDLLKALRALDDVVNEQNGHPNGWEAALVIASDNAREAIAKAT